MRRGISIVPSGELQSRTIFWNLTGMKHDFEFGTKVTWQAASVIVAVAVGTPFLWGAIRGLHKPSLVIHCAIFGGIGGLLFIWGGLGIRSRFNALPSNRARAAFVIRLLAGVISQILGAWMVRVAFKHSGATKELVATLGVGFIGGGFAAFIRAMTIGD